MCNCTCRYIYNISSLFILLLMFQSADVKIMESINQLVRDNVDVLTTSRTVEEGLFVVHMFIVYCLPFIVYCLYHMSQLSSMCTLKFYYHHVGKFVVFLLATQKIDFWTTCVLTLCLEGQLYMSYKNFITKCKVKKLQSVIGHFPGQLSCLSDNNELWLNRLSDQRIRMTKN